VVGQDGWPLGKDGRLTRKLQQARWRQRSQPLVILTEADFLARLGLDASSGDVQCLSTAQLSSVVHVSGDRIRSWVQLGLVQPTETLHGVHYFDFQQVRWAKTLCDFAQAGVAPGRIRRSLEQLKNWMPDVDRPLAQLAVLEKDGQLVVRLREGLLAEPTGQGLFDFSEEPAAATVQVASGPQTAEQWFQAGCEHEQAGRLAEAARAYRQVLRAGRRDPDACFNLANVLYALGQKEQAAERFRQVVEVDPRYAEAWNNLGVVLSELDQYEEAVAALQSAVQSDPSYADAHFNLADTLDQLERQSEALPHWRAYVHLDPTSPWGRYARERLGKADRPKQA